MSLSNPGPIPDPQPDPVDTFVEGLKTRIPDPPPPTQRLEHNLDGVIQAELTRDQRIRFYALDQAVRSLPPSYGQTTVVLTIAGLYEDYIHNGNPTL